MHILSRTHLSTKKYLLSYIYTKCNTAEHDKCCFHDQNDYTHAHNM